MSFARALAPFAFASLVASSFACKKPVKNDDAARSTKTDDKKASADKAQKPAKKYSVDDVCNRIVDLYEAPDLHGPGDKVDPDVRKKDMDECLADAKKTQADDEAKFECMGPCAYAAKDRTEAARCRRYCEHDPRAFCAGVIDDLQEVHEGGPTESDVSSTNERCSKSLGKGNEANVPCRRDCYFAAKTLREIWLCADKVCAAE